MIESIPSGRVPAALAANHRLGQNSILSGAKTMLISRVIREKNQRLEAVRRVHCIDQWFSPTPNDSNPACDQSLSAAARAGTPGTLRKNH